MVMIDMVLFRGNLSGDDSEGDSKGESHGND